MKIRILNGRARTVSAVLLLLLVAGCGDDGTSPSGNEPSQELFAAADTYVDTASPDTPQGASGLLRAGGGRTAYLKFPLEALDENAVITSVRLYLTQAADDPAPAAVLTVSHVAADGWLESTATANDPPGASDAAFGTATLGPLASGERRVAVAATAGLAAVCDDWFHGNRVISLEVSSTEDVAFLSSEFSVAGAVPRLEVQYDTGTRLVLYPTANGYVDGYYADVNRSPADTLMVDREMFFTFLKFDLSDLPSAALVRSAELTMTAFNGFAFGGDGNVYTRLVTDDSWTETGLTASTAPAASAETYGSWWLWYDMHFAEQVGRNRSAALTELVDAEAGGVMSLRLDSPGYMTMYFSRANADAAKRPRLEVLYTR